MPTLNWIGKEAVVNHHAQVPFRLLKDVPDLACGDPGSGNLIVQGDNLEALKALLPYYAGQVKCIYIDPPYNTGNEGWAYNDNVNSPVIREWLGKVVGKEGETLDRHDRWLCMMYPRLVLLKQFLREDGSIFISIENNELFNLKLLCDEIFGAQCFITNLVWQRTYSPRNDSKGIPSETDSILVYAKHVGWKPNQLARTSEMDSRYATPDNDPRPWTSGDASAPGANTHPGMVYAIQHPITGKMLYPTNSRHWSYGQDLMLDFMQSWARYELQSLDDREIRQSICGNSIVVPDIINAIVLSDPIEEVNHKSLEKYKQGNWPVLYFTGKGKGGIRLKRYLEEMGGRLPTNLWKYTEVGHTDEAAKELKALFDGKSNFDTPKPTRLIERILQIATNPGDLVMDSFAGSGTTGHAVLKMNAANAVRAEIAKHAEEYPLLQPSADSASSARNLSYNAANAVRAEIAKHAEEYPLLQTSADNASTARNLPNHVENSVRAETAKNAEEYPLLEPSADSASSARNLSYNAANAVRAETAKNAEEYPLLEPSASSARNPARDRRFILVEIEPEIARNVTAERVRRVAEGYTNAKGAVVEGLGGGFRYCELGEALFDETGMIRKSVKFSELARHVFFSETGEPLPRARVLNTPLIGDYNGVGIYLLYNGILGDDSMNGGNVLTRQILAKLPPFDGPKVIYCAGCLLSQERLQAARITIRQTPYGIKVS